MAGNPGLILREMTAADLPAVVAIERQVQFAPWSGNLFAEGMERGHQCRVSADHEARVAGFSVVQYILDEAHLLNIAVDPARQGIGAGRQLLDSLIDAAVDNKSTMVFLEVRSGNQRALRLYQMAGFNEVGLRRNYYPSANGKEDAVMMALML